MNNEARRQFDQFVTDLARFNGVQPGHVAQKFNVSPTIQQRLESAMQDTDVFLRSVNIVPVDEMIGEKIGLGVSSPIASRTDTSGAAERQPRDVKALTSQRYECVQTNYDTAIRYAVLDSWAKFPDFAVRLRDAIVKRQALDRLMVAFNGVSAAADTDLSANPMLQDVNIGWLQHIRTEAPEHHLFEGAAAGKITVGATGDYKNLDALIYEVAHTMIDPWHRGNLEMRAILGRDLETEHVVPLISTYPQPTEREALQRLIAQSRVGGVGTMLVPFVPDNAILLTIPANLSIYYQSGARRRQVIDNPKKDRIENFESSNDAFVVEDFGACALIENIEFV